MENAYGRIEEAWSPQQDKQAEQQKRSGLALVRGRNNVKPLAMREAAGKNSFRSAEKMWRRPRALRTAWSPESARSRTASAVIVVPGANSAASVTARRCRRAAAASLHDEAPAAVATSISKHWFSQRYPANSCSL
ncbi:hypothetical protein [Paraburkholderia sp. J76]|uniref:hypothetical protein n=1 Tax=Paraburkholderia sp. J76 TaxID=2805439 RepID=UPI002ABE92B6|nr:hypothetical protein [Paraburkholderia sp. J76]